jgi:hypothetical protein
VSPLVAGWEVRATRGGRPFTDSGLIYAFLPWEMLLSFGGRVFALLLALPIILLLVC